MKTDIKSLQTALLSSISRDYGTRIANVIENGLSTIIAAAEYSSDGSGSNYLNPEQQHDREIARQARLI